MYGVKGSCKCMMFEEYNLLGDEIEKIYKKLYKGGGISFGSNIDKLVDILSTSSKAGIITNITRKKIENFLTKAINHCGAEVVSNNTHNIEIKYSFMGDKYTFNLEDFIMWITEELCRDRLMKKALCSRENYEGVKMVLNDFCKKKNYFSINQENLWKDKWIDFYILKDMVFYTEKKNEKIHLYFRKYIDAFFELCREEKYYEEDTYYDFAEELFDGRIFCFEDETTVLVQTDKDHIKQVRVSTDGKYECFNIAGTIIDQLEDGSILLMEDSKLIRLMPKGENILIADNIFGGMIGIDENNVFWKNNVTNNCKYAKQYDKNGGRCLKADKLSNEMLWKGLLFTLYNFDCMRLNNNIGDRLRFVCAFDRIPFPFNMQEIVRRLSEIDEYCYSQDLIKTDKYAEVMGYIMSVEDEVFSEAKTHSTLEYILGNISINPYELIVAKTGMGVMNYIDFLFDGLDDIFKETDDYYDITCAGFDPGSSWCVKSILDNYIREIEEKD